MTEKRTYPQNTSTIQQTCNACRSLIILHDHIYIRLNVFVLYRIILTMWNQLLGRREQISTTSERYNAEVNGKMSFTAVTFDFRLQRNPCFLWEEDWKKKMILCPSLAKNAWIALWYAKEEANMEHPPYSPQSFWPRQENWCTSPAQNRVPPVRARHWIKHKITFFLWNFRVFRRILCQILAPSITASLLSWTIVSALSFPPTLLTILLLFPRLASCLPTCRNTLSCPRHTGLSWAA